MIFYWSPANVQEDWCRIADNYIHTCNQPTIFIYIYIDLLCTHWTKCIRVGLECVQWPQKAENNEPTKILFRCSASVVLFGILLSACLRMKLNSSVCVRVCLCLLLRLFAFCSVREFKANGTNVNRTKRRKMQDRINFFFLSWFRRKWVGNYTLNPSTWYRYHQYLVLFKNRAYPLHVAWIIESPWDRTSHDQFTSSRWPLSRNLWPD